MKIIFVRHGDTTVKADDVVQSTDNMLSPEGVLQAKNVAEKLLDHDFEIIVSSPLPRAIDTANIINEKFNKKLIINNNLAEVKWPTILEGISVEDPKVVGYRQLRNKNNVSDISWHYSDEENFVDLRNRAVKLLDELVELRVENMLVVTHSTFMKVLVTVMCHGKDVTWPVYYDFLTFAKPKHTSMSTFELDEKGKWHMDSWNL